MTDSDKKSLEEALEENIDVFSEEMERTLQIDDFVWVERVKPQIIQEIDDEEHSEIVTTSIAMVAPYDSFRESSGDTVLSQNEYSDEKKAGGEAVVTSDLDEELLMDQQYWDKYGSTAKKMINIKSKFPTSQTRTLKEHKKKNIAPQITSNHPSYYQFDKETTAILETFQKKNYVGPYRNVVYKGPKSVVINSHILPFTVAKMYSPHLGLAVKVYKLGKDEQKNCKVLKRAQKEFEHLKILRHSRVMCVPYGVYTYKNVTVLSFVGRDQQTAPSIKSLPLECSKEMYDMIVRYLRTWYKNEIVHGRLSSKYIRIWWDRPWILGWSHSVRIDHPQALKKLMRDCHFVTKFFERRDVQVKSTLELFEETTCEKISRNVLLYGGSPWQQHEHQENPNRREESCRPRGNCRFKS